MRTFLYKPSWLDWAGIILLLLGCIVCFWHRENTALIIAGTVLIIVLLRAIDRSFHTIYSLDNEQLIIKTGRIAKADIIPLAKIKHSSLQKLAMGAGEMVIIELENGRSKSLLPEDPAAFLLAIRKRSLKSEL